MPNLPASRAVHATRRARAWALATILLAVGLTLIFPHAMGTLPDGMRTPIIAFELARLPHEVETMFGPPGVQRAIWASLMEVGNHVDFLFLLAYGGFYVTFAQALSPGGRRGEKLAIVLGILAPLMDVAENLQLLAIGRDLGGSYELALSRLVWFTWLKWLLCCGVLLSWVPGLVRAGWLGRMVAVLSGLATLSALVAIQRRGVAAECMALFVTLAGAAAGALTLRSRIRSDSVITTPR
jgi:hypothetical protein